MKNKISILGLGWLGLPLAKRLLENNFEVRGSTTSLEKLGHLSKNPFYVGRVKIEKEGIIGDWEAFLGNSDTLIINFPPKRIENIEEIYPEQIEHIINHTSSEMKVVFVSSTSVYGNTNDIVREEDNIIPDKASGRGVLAAEKLLSSYFKENLTILRLSGLIGPKRHPGRFLAKKKSLKNPIVPVNLIHLEDSIGLIEAIINQDCYGEIINGCASAHPVRKEFYEKAAIALELPPPTFEDEGKNKYKIVDNTKSKTLLNYHYKYDNPEQIFDQRNMHPVQIIGTGPGALNLLTLEAHKSIQEAEIILHDNLVTDEILHINNQAEAIYVGRKYGDHSNQMERQNAINQMLENYFKQGKKVVRLKSGDPYIYGRAAEEARCLTEKKVPFKVLPGVSAAFAAASLCNVPITERKKSNAILICTAHTANYTFEQLHGIATILKSGNTIALYMGLKSMDKIVPKLMEVCQDGSIPINAISNVSRPDQVLLASTLENIIDDISKTPLEMPVVFLIGTTPIAL